MPRTRESSMSWRNSPACTHVFPKTSTGVTRNVVSVPATNGASAAGPAAVKPVTSHAAANTVTVTGVAGVGPFPRGRTSLGMRTVLLAAKVYTCRHPQTRRPLSGDQVGVGITATFVQEGRGVADIWSTGRARLRGRPVGDRDTSSESKLETNPTRV